MLPKSQRLNLKKDFKWVTSGKKLESKLLKLFIKFGENTFPRLGVALSAGYFKKATQRNRARRLTSRAFQLTWSRLPASANIVVLPKTDILDVKLQDVLADLEGLLKGEKIIN